MMRISQQDLALGQDPTLTTSLIIARMVGGPSPHLLHRSRIGCETDLAAGLEATRLKAMTVNIADVTAETKVRTEIETGTGIGTGRETVVETETENVSAIGKRNGNEIATERKKRRKKRRKNENETGIKSGTALANVTVNATTKAEIATENENENENGIAIVRGTVARRAVETSEMIVRGLHDMIERRKSDEGMITERIDGMTNVRMQKVIGVRIDGTNDGTNDVKVGVRTSTMIEKKTGAETTRDRLRPHSATSRIRIVAIGSNIETMITLRTWIRAVAMGTIRCQRDRRRRDRRQIHSAIMS